MNDLLVVGAGPMGSAYVPILKTLGVDFAVVGRGITSASRLQDKYRVTVHTGGLKHYLCGRSAPYSAIVAVPIEQLAACTEALALAGTKRILVEKPGALGTGDLSQLMTSLARTQARVWIGYNRRFLQSVLAARSMINEDGGVTSFFFEFSEWVDRVLASSASSQVKERWVVANSSHVIDLAFHLGGLPALLATWTEGSLIWHRSGERFTGAGSTEGGALFSYRSDWSSPGRWKLELNTSRRRLLLSPLEEVYEMRSGSGSFKLVAVNNEIDRKFKPGLFCQTKAFIEGDRDLMCSIKDQSRQMPLFEKIAGY